MRKILPIVLPWHSPPRRFRPATLSRSHLGDPRRQRIPDVSQRHLSDDGRNPAQDGHLSPPHRDGSAAHHHLHARRILGGGQQGRRHPEPAAVDGDGLERGQRRIPAGARHAGARSGRGLLLRAALRRPASHDVQRRRQSHRGHRRIGGRTPGARAGHSSRRAKDSTANAPRTRRCPRSRRCSTGSASATCRM